MKTLILTVSLFTAPAPVVEAPLFDLQAAQAQVKSYVMEDLNSVSHMLRNSVRDAMQLGIKLGSTLQAEKQAETRTVAMILPEAPVSDEVE